MPITATDSSRDQITLPVFSLVIVLVAVFGRGRALPVPAAHRARAQPRLHRARAAEPCAGEAAARIQLALRPPIVKASADRLPVACGWLLLVQATPAGQRHRAAIDLPIEVTAGDGGRR